MTGLPHFNQGFEAGEFDYTKLYGCWLEPLRLILDRGILVFNDPPCHHPGPVFQYHWNTLPRTQQLQEESERLC